MENAPIVLTPSQQQEVEALLADVKPHADIIANPNADVASAEFQGANDQLFRVLIKLDRTSKHYQMKYIEETYHLIEPLSGFAEEDFNSLELLGHFGNNPELAVVLVKKYNIMPRLLDVFLRKDTDDEVRIAVLKILQRLAMVQHDVSIKEDMIVKYRLIDLLSAFVTSNDSEMCRGSVFVIVGLAKNAHPAAHHLIIASGILQKIIPFFHTNLECRLLLQNMSFTGDPAVVAVLKQLDVPRMCADYLKVEATDLPSIVTLSNLTGKHESTVVQIDEKGLEEVTRIAVMILLAQESASSFLRAINISTKTTVLLPRDCSFILFPLDILTTSATNQALLAASQPLLHALLHALQLRALDVSNRMRVLRILRRLLSQPQLQHPQHQSQQPQLRFSPKETHLMRLVADVFVWFEHLQLLLLCDKKFGRKRSNGLPPAIVRLIGFYLLLACS